MTRGDARTNGRNSPADLPAARLGTRENEFTRDNSNILCVNSAISLLSGEKNPHPTQPFPSVTSICRKAFYAEMEFSHQSGFSFIPAIR